MRIREFTIDGIRVGDDTDCYVIAEIGHNHQGDLEQAKKMIQAAAAAGANAAKLQKRDNRSLFTKAYYDRPYSSENSFGDTYGAHREFLEFGEREYRELQAFSKTVGITFFATAFDFESADFLGGLNVPAFKIASGDLTNTPLIRYVARFGKPIILSSGGGTMEDVDRAIDTLRQVDAEYCMMQCTAGYPPAWEELNLSVITAFRERYPEAVIGFSSHDNGIAMAIAAHVLGSRMVEKHFTLNRAMKGTDHAFSLEPQGLGKMVRDLRRLRLAMGDGEKRQFASEKDPLTKMGKRLVAACPIAAGTVLTREHIAIKSPGGGTPAYHLDEVIGRQTRLNIDVDHDIALDNLQ
jgi:N-acetylneuraminate synthase/sialic acid synthase